MRIAPIALVFLGSLGMPASAQMPPDRPGESKVVLRVSREFLRQLVGVKFTRDEAIDQNANGASVIGHARVEGTFDVRLIKSEKRSDFDLLVNGSLSTEIAADRRPVEVFARGTGSFAASRRIIFADKAFTGGPIEVRASHRFCLQDIAPYRRGVGGALTRVLAAPLARRGLRDGDRAAESELHAQLTQAIEKETDKLLAALHKIGATVRKGEELLVKEGRLPKTGLQTYHAATDEHLLFSIGLAGQRMPMLPELGEADQAPLELWIARKEEAREARLRFLRAHWKDIQPIVHAQIARRSPEAAKKLAAILDKVHMVEAGRWHVVTFAPELRERPPIAIP